MSKRVKDSCAFITEYIAGSPDYEEYFGERQIGYEKIGIAAFNCSERLRDLYKLPPIKFDEDGWSPRLILEERKDYALGKKTAREEQNGRLGLD